MIANYTNGGGGGSYSSASSGDAFDLKTLGMVGAAAYIGYKVLM